MVPMPGKHNLIKIDVSFLFNHSTGFIHLGKKFYLFFVQLFLVVIGQLEDIFYDDYLNAMRFTRPASPYFPSTFSFANSFAHHLPLWSSVIFLVTLPPPKRIA